MARPIRIGVTLQPANAPNYATWRSAAVHAEELGADLVFGWDHFHRPEMVELNQGIPVLAEVQPDVTNFEGWTALASWGGDHSPRPDRAAGDRDGLPQSRSARRHGPHRRSHQRRTPDTRPRCGLVREGLHHLRIRIRHVEDTIRPVRGRVGTHHGTLRQADPTARAQDTHPHRRHRPQAHIAVGGPLRRHLAHPSSRSRASPRPPPDSTRWPPRQDATGTTSNARCTGSASTAPRTTAPPAQPFSSTRSRPIPPPDTTSPPSKKC